MAVEEYKGEVNEVPFSRFVRDILPKYIDEQGMSEKTGLVGKYGKIDIQKLQNMYDPNQPYMIAYYVVHGDMGFKSFAPTYWDRNKSEPLCKNALDEKKTWEEIVGFKGYKKGNLY